MNITGNDLYMFRFWWHPIGMSSSNEVDQYKCFLVKLNDAVKIEQLIKLARAFAQTTAPRNVEIWYLTDIIKLNADDFSKNEYIFSVEQEIVSFLSVGIEITKDIDELLQKIRVAKIPDLKKLIEGVAEVNPQMTLTLRQKLLKDTSNIDEFFSMN